MLRLRAMCEGQSKSTGERATTRTTFLSCQEALGGMDKSSLAVAKKPLSEDAEAYHSTTMRCVYCSPFTSTMISKMPVLIVSGSWTVVRK